MGHSTLTTITTDRAVLRDLAKQVADIAAKPIQQERIARWQAHNSLQSTEPMLLFFPEGAWQELIPPETLQCQDDVARILEIQLRRQIYTDAHFEDDTVIDGIIKAPAVLHNTGWGIATRQIASTEKRGAWKFDPVLQTKQDLDKLQLPRIEFDEAATTRHRQYLQDLVGDILTVQPIGVNHISYHIQNWYTRLRGLEEAMMDMACDQDFIHAAMQIYVEGMQGELRQLQELNLLSLNNDNTYQSSGGNGWTDELPQDDVDPQCIRPCDMWASAESQEMAQVGPAMHREFSLAYEQQLLAPFGLVGYGCCEDLTAKLGDVCSLPNMRRISISPWADVVACAEHLKDRYIFSWKPNPAYLVGDFNEATIEADIARTLDAASSCVLEIILKDTHTCQNRPDRFDRWSQIARRLIDERRA